MAPNLFSTWDPYDSANLRSGDYGQPNATDNPDDIPRPPGAWDRALDWAAPRAGQYVDAMARVGRYLNPPPPWRGEQASPGAPRIVGGRGSLQPWQSPTAPNLAGRADQYGLFPRFYTYARAVGTAARGGSVDNLAPHEYAALDRHEGRPADGSSPHLFRGPGGGQQDTLDAKVSPGEYIFSAEDVSMMGDGSNEEGARKLDGMRGALRMHKTGRKQFPPKARNPLNYLRKK